LQAAFSVTGGALAISGATLSTAGAGLTVNTSASSALQRALLAAGGGLRVVTRVFWFPEPVCESLQRGLLAVTKQSHNFRSPSKSSRNLSLAGRRRAHAVAKNRATARTRCR
jgi:hypothetical protein